ncbi:MAG: MgtC/SapB family protein [Candidatus Eremiobacteraeota bacterium]|nr:MgtC/SapB family protein [Candidatus Eremiobacteraeota bacterium]
MIHGANLVLDLILAAILGGAVGIQRQAAQKPAGFRTHLLVALASCAFAEVGRLTGDDRITANVLQGIGFLGAGAIFRSGFTAHGLTTAASIWTVAAIGVAVGYGHPYSLVIGVTVTIVTVLVLLLSDRLFSRVFVHHANIKVICALEATTRIAQAFHDHGMQYQAAGEFRVSNTEAGSIVELEYHLNIPRDGKLGMVVREIAALAGVRDVISYAVTESSV